MTRTDIRRVRAGGLALVTAILVAAPTGPTLAADASPAASSEPTVGGSLASLGATTLLADDVFGGQRSMTGISGDGQVTNADGVLELSPSDARRPLVHRHALEAAWPVLRVDASVEFGPDSRVGLHCASAELDRAFTAGFVSSRGVSIGRFDGESFTRGASAEHGQRSWPVSRLAVACAMTPSGGERVAVWIDGALVLEHEFESTVGPFDALAISAETTSPPQPARLTDVDVRVGEAHVPTTTGGPLVAVLSDGFDDPAAWGAVDDGERTIAIDESTLRAEVADAGLSVWSWRGLDTAMPSMRVDADVAFETSGVGGVMCGGGDEPRFFVGVVLTDGRAAIGRLVDSRVAVLELLTLPPGVTADGPAPLRLSLECLARADGERIALSIDGVLVASTWQDETIGPFGRAGLFVESLDGPALARFDSLEVASGP